MTFELRHLRYSLAVADHRSFRRAAEALGVHQSALSRRVRDLEDRLGVSLFERGQHGARLTAAGEALLRDVRVTIHALEHTMARAGAVGRAEHGRLLIGHSGSLVCEQMLHVLAAFRKESAEVEPHLTEDSTTSLIQSLFDRRLDVALLRAQLSTPGLATLPLWREEILVAAPKGHPIAKLSAVTPQHLRGERLLVAHCNDCAHVHRAICQTVGSDVRMTFHECHSESTVMLAAAGFGIAIVGSGATTSFGGVTFVPLKADLPVLEVTAVWSPSADNPALRRFISILRQHRESAQLGVTGTPLADAPTSVLAASGRRDRP